MGPEWILSIFHKLPENQQAFFQRLVIKAAQNPYYLPLSTIPAAWILCYFPHFCAVSVKIGKVGMMKYNNDTPRTENPEKYPKLYARCAGAHFNALEMFPAFAAAVLIARVQKVKPKLLLNLAMKYLKLRVLYTLLYIGGINPIVNGCRTLVWAMLARTCLDIYGLAM